MQIECLLLGLMMLEVTCREQLAAFILINVFLIFPHKLKFTPAKIKCYFQGRKGF